MAARGRKSAASLSVATTGPGERPAPPKGLTKFQRAEWQAIVDRLPADWFTTENLPLLAQYVRHVENADRLAKAVDKFDLPLDNMGAAETFDKLTKMLEREGRAMSSLATRLRLTQQSRYNAQSANTASKNAGTAEKPWDG